MTTNPERDSLVFGVLFGEDITAHHLARAAHRYDREKS
ncbi:hypothetical protein SAMN05444421_101352 [Celeribacter marinus]|uniref:Uncharacterized protein n=1 Tax=Celeribacter marinus TaxID=1397108 RepID=A0A0N7HIG4_9RHOB|nr:hypothetical protein IMCC12053_1201 [Celeribacter marinus]SFK08020.1 hypothetical protein SAMN05444421_101352 [Celeribacter marinus]